MVFLTVPYFDRLQHSATFRRALRGALASFIGLLVAVTVQFASAVSWSFPPSSSLARPSPPSGSRWISSGWFWRVERFPPSSFDAWSP